MIKAALTLTVSVPRWRFLILLCLCISFHSFRAYSQQTSYQADEVKAALLAQIIRNLTWPSSKSTTDYTIAVWQDKQISSAFSALNGVKINGQPLTVIDISRIQSLESETFTAHVLYIPEKQLSFQTEIALLLRGTGTLVVTENSPSLHNTMINLVTSQQDNENAKLQFDINRPNIVFESIRISPELVLFGGSEVDIADLYYQTELAIRDLRQQNESTFEQIQQQQKTLQEKEAEFKILQRQSKSITQELANKQAELAKNELRLSENESKLNELLSRVEDVEQQYRDARLSAESKNDELTRAEQSLTQYAQDVERQRTVLSDLQMEIERSQTLLSEQKQRLAIAESEVQSQSEVIEQQRDIIYIILFIVIAAILVSIIITKLLLNNKKINAELQQALRHLTETQEQLIESEKLASLGQLVAGVAHEVNTPIGIALTATTTLGSDVKNFHLKAVAGELRKSDVTRFTNKLTELDELIQGNLLRCHELVENFKQVSADQVVSQNRTIELKHYCENIMSTLSVLFKRNQIESKVIGDNPKLDLDPGILSQVVTNLATNAVNHAFDGIDNRLVTIEISQAAQHVNITFIDNGVGMDEDVRTRLFDPFFTTKRGKGGTGLGMNIVYNLVTSKLNGTVVATSKPGHGTTIQIQLPTQA